MGMLDYSNLLYRVERMTPQDVPTVMEIEMEAFSAPWSARAYDYELHYNEMAHYYVVQPNEELMVPVAVERQSLWKRILTRERATTELTLLAKPIVGYGGFWMMVDEAHISTLATHIDWRQRGIGELLLVALIDGAVQVGARWVTLEVRVSNIRAQALYRKYGFDVTGMRKHYYSDNNEDALIMTTPLCTSIDYQQRVQELKSDVWKRLARQP